MAAGAPRATSSREPASLSATDSSEMLSIKNRVCWWGGGWGMEVQALKGGRGRGGGGGRGGCIGSGGKGAVSACVRACVRAWGWVQTCWGETAAELMAFPRGDAVQVAGSRHTTGQTFPSPSLCGWIARSREGDTKKHMRHV